MNKFFKFPFAAQGDKVVVPDDVQNDGSVSYEQGFGYDYARNLANDPLAKPMPRDKTNQIFNDVTQAIREYQTLGIPDYITAELNGGESYAYAKFATVRYSGSVYVSLKDYNTSLPTVSADWDEVTGAKATNAEAEDGTDDVKIMTPAKVNKAIQKLAPAPTIATQAQAESGTDNAAMMTPLRVAQAIQYSAVPAGKIAHFARTTAPAGYLKANGAAVPRTVYAALFAAIGTTFGAGDGSTTFKLPDLRGEFLRGLDDGRGVDSGRTLGSAQLDALQRMTGDVGAVPATSANHSYAGVFFPTGYGFNEYASTSGRSYYHGIGFDSSLVARSADETRPRNLAFLACIKY